mgnify:FL=1
MKQAKLLNLLINPTEWDSIVAYPSNIEYIFKAKPYANNHILISATARETKENMIWVIWNNLITETFFTAVENKVKTIFDKQ